MWKCIIEDADLNSELERLCSFSNERRDMLILKATNILLDHVFMDGEFNKFQIFKELFKLNVQNEFVFENEDGYKYAKVTIWEQNKTN
jgi:hypothetical protein